MGRSRRLLQPLLHQFAHVREFQDFYEQSSHLQGPAFVAELLHQLQITISYDPAELRRLPATGAFIAVANHPSGLLDGLVLLHLLGQHRPELRVVANELLAPLLPHIDDQLVLINANQPAGGQNAHRMRRMLRYLHNDVPLALFPAGEVAHRTAPFRPSLDPEWHPTVGKLLTSARVPVVPVWLSGHNSALFSWLGLVQPWLRTMRLPAELLNKRGQTIRVRIGQPIGPQELVCLPPDQRLPCLRAWVYALGSPAEAPAVTWPRLPPQPIVAETAADLIEADLAALRPARRLLVHGPWEVYVARKVELPHVLPEIGRLRELTFRRVGEGTHQPTDLDAYDEYYRHLFLYHRDDRRLVGAYRVGKGRGILRQHGKRGLYLHSLFRMKKELLPLLRESLELGRSFIREEYQRQPLPLALLWKGIAEYVASHPEYRYLIGPVSISNTYSAASKAAMVDYLTQNFLATEHAQWVRPRKAYRYRPLDASEAPAALQAGLASLQDLQNLIAHLEPGGMGVPVLLRQYLKQNARLLGFNIDPKFANALDGFLLLEARDLPLRILRLLDRTTAGETKEKP
jgi:putative hemolysin